MTLKRKCNKCGKDLWSFMDMEKHAALNCIG